MSPSQGPNAAGNRALAPRRCRAACGVESGLLVGVRAACASTAQGGGSR